MADISKYLPDVKKYAPNADEVAVEGIVKYLGIALRSRDASLVSATDETEVQRVVDKFVTKKLGITDTSGPGAVKAVLDRMKADRTKERVTVYYLLAEHYGKLAMFHPKAKA